MNKETKKIYKSIPMKIVTDILPDPTRTICEMNKGGYLRDDILPCSSEIAWKLQEEGCEVFELHGDNRKGYWEPSSDDEYEYYKECAVSRDDWHNVLKRNSLRDIKMKFWSKGAGIDYSGIPFDTTISILPDTSSEMVFIGGAYTAYYTINSRTALALMQAGDIRLFTRKQKYSAAEPFVYEDDPNFTYTILIRKDDWEDYLIDHSIKEVYEKLWATDSIEDESINTEETDLDLDNPLYW